MPDPVELTINVCPVCSVPPHARYAPELMPMHRSTALLKTRVSMFLGCVHVERVTCKGQAEHDAAVQAWNLKSTALFDAKTDSWTDEQRERLRATLNGAGMAF